MNQAKEPLYRSCYGQSICCPKSGGFWLYFGDMQLWLCHERLRQLARKINQLVSVSERPHNEALSKQIILCPPGSDGEVFVFSFDELLDLQILVNGTLAMADLYDFLHDNQLHIDD
ncbi:hypothetical protein GO755_16925 [Spirosoma sp. HMF4905]|uniref:Uncharacterized protein n=1 Tax=Spirosoma arboris TaxID=2682092 RepID=A0A7K1SD39_9BACT|nr:hypothetical protein [Spirosoma arboris]MVM31734.1 hypothetical protein [Spirosoma arboris]